MPNVLHHALTDAPDLIRKSIKVDPDPALPDPILDALSELYWEERINHPAVAALRP